jgi:hypothetical protein
MYALGGLVLFLLVLTGIFLGKEEGPRQGKVSENMPQDSAAARTYAVMVVSTPSGAEIFLNGASTGKLTPAEFSGLLPGKKYRLQLKKEGFGDYSEELSSLEARDQVLVLTLPSQAMAQLAVTSVPAGAEIFMNGHSSGWVTPHQFAQLAFAQKVVVTLRMEGYKEASEVLTLARTEAERQLHFDLERIIQTYDVNITANVAGAKVRLNGRDYGLTPLATSLPEGKYTLIVSQDGYQDLIQTFVVRDHEKSISLVLEKEKQGEIL